MMDENLSTPAPRRRGAPGITGAILLIAIGVVVLLDNLNILSVSWLSLLRFWPVILILVGLDIILGRRSALGSLIAAGVAAVVIGGLIWMVGVTGQWGIKPGDLVTRDVIQGLDGARSLEVHLNISVMETQLDALQDGDNAVEGTHKTDIEDLTVDWDYNLRGDVGILTINQKGNTDNIGFPSGITNELDLGLTNNVPIDLVVDAGVGETTLDLTGIDLRSLEIKAGVGSLKIILPDQGEFEVSIDAGVGSVELTVPEDLEARIEYEGGLSSLDIPDRFDKKGDDVWQSDHYTGATDFAEIKINAGVGEVTILD